MFSTLREALEVGFTDTSFAGLHPRLANNAAEALSTVEEMLSFADGHTLFDLGLDGLQPHVSSAFFAAIDRTGAKAQVLGYNPVIVNLGERVDRFDVPAPIMVTVASSTSANAAIVVVKFNDVTDLGYADWNTADGWVVDLRHGIDEANRRALEFGRAIKVLNAVMDEMSRVNGQSRRTYSDGPAF